MVCFVVFILPVQRTFTRIIYTYSSGLLHWYWDNNWTCASWKGGRKRAQLQHLLLLIVPLNEFYFTFLTLIHCGNCCFSVTSVALDFTNPRMHLFHIPECSIQNRNVHISVLNGAFWDMEQVHSGICELGLLYCSSASEVMLNTLMLRQNRCHFADGIFKGIFLNENVWIVIKIFLKYISKGPINNIPSLG